MIQSFLETHLLLTDTDIKKLIFSIELTFTTKYFLCFYLINSNK